MTTQRRTAIGDEPTPGRPHVLAACVGSLWRWPSVKARKLELVAEVAAANLFATVWASCPADSPVVVAGRAKHIARARADVPSAIVAGGGSGTWFVSAHWWDNTGEAHRSYALAFDARPTAYDVANACVELWERSAA